MPQLLDWDASKQLLVAGARVNGFVTSVAPYGSFVDIPGVASPGIIKVTDVRDEGTPWPGLPAVGTQIEAIVIGHKEHCREIRLSIKPSVLAKAGSVESTS